MFGVLLIGVGIAICVTLVAWKPIRGRWANPKADKQELHMPFLRQQTARKNASGFFKDGCPNKIE